MACMPLSGRASIDTSSSSSLRDLESIFCESAEGSDTVTREKHRSKCRFKLQVLHAMSIFYIQRIWSIAYLGSGNQMGPNS